MPDGQVGDAETNVDLVNVTARVPRSLRADARIVCIKRGHTLQRVIIAALQQYIEVNHELLAEGRQGE